MHEYWIRNNKHYGNFADPEIAELIKIHDHYTAAGNDPEFWSEADWQEFERDRLAFEHYHNQHTI